MDYGYFNQFLGREVDKAWWGTRTEHIVGTFSLRCLTSIGNILGANISLIFSGVAGCLAVTDHMSQHFFSKYLGRPLCFAKSPATFVAHTFLFIFSGVAIYCGLDSAFNPAHEGRRVEELKSNIYSTYIGTNTAWYEPYVAPALAKVAGPAVANTWFGSALLPATLAYSTVKGKLLIGTCF